MQSPKARQLSRAFLVITLLCLTASLRAQTTAEIVAAASWDEFPVAEGVTAREAQFEILLGGPQDISIAEADLSVPGVALQLVGAEGIRKSVSQFAQPVLNAAAAINGNWFDPATKLPIQFTRIGGQIRASTAPNAQERGGLAIGADGSVSCSPRPAQGWESVNAPHVMATEIPLLVDGQPYMWTPPGAPDYAYYYTNRHPRTALGITTGSKVLLVVVDGRRADALGASYAHMAELLAALGCSNAIALDGGGSSTCWVRTRGVLNSPSDGSERLVGDAIVVTARPLPVATSGAIIVEARPGGQNRAFYSEEGIWADSATDCTAPGTTPGIGQRYGSTYRSVAGLKRAFFHPGIPQENDEVFVVWGAGPNRRNGILYRVVSADGETTRTIDQSGTANQWVSLGVHRFSAGTQGYVEVSNAHTDESGSMYSGAAKLAPLAKTAQTHWGEY